MKILLVSTAAIKTPPDGYGGMEREVAWLKRGIKESGQDIKVDLVAAPGSPEARFEADDEAEFPKLLDDYIDDYNVVIDFSHDKRIGRQWPDKPQINVYQVMTIGWKRNPVYISKGQRDYIGVDGPVIYYGVDRDIYPIYHGPRCNYMLYIGSLIQEKRVHWVAQAADLLRKAGDDVEVVIAGPRWQPEYWPTLEKVQSLPFVTIYDEVAGDDKLNLIQQAAALVHPVGGAGWVEAGAIIVLEALTCGTPVISTNNGCLSEYIHPNLNGYLADSPQAIAEAFRKVSSIDPGACRASTTHFNYQRMANDYIELAQEVINGKEW